MFVNPKNKTAELVEEDLLMALDIFGEYVADEDSLPPEKEDALDDDDNIESYNEDDEDLDAYDPYADDWDDDIEVDDVDNREDTNVYDEPKE